MKVFLVDDEPLALKRLSRMLASSGRAELAGMSTDPVEAAEAIAAAQPDVLFLDIEMPVLNGFEMLAKLESQPLVIFTTAYDRYALQAFGVNSIDYLLKPVTTDQLYRALTKAERILGGREPRPHLEDLLKQLRQPEYIERVGSRIGDRIEFIAVSRVSHFFASDKLTYAAASKPYVIDATIEELERRLDPRKFVRIHRGIILNLDYLHELHAWFGGRMQARLKDEKTTQLTVSRDRVRELKARLGI